jgi:hypothetical protein
MKDPLIIDLPEVRLPRDMARRIRFHEAVERHARRLGLPGRFALPRFFGYYFIEKRPMAVAGLWTVLVSEVPLMMMLRESVDRATDGRCSITSPAAGRDPEFILVHDRYDCSCWLWSFRAARRFLSATGAVRKTDPDAVDENGDGDGDPRLLGS